MLPCLEGSENMIGMQRIGGVNGDDLHLRILKHLAVRIGDRDAMFRCSFFSLCFGEVTADNGAAKSTFFSSDQHGCAFVKPKNRNSQPLLRRQFSPVTSCRNNW